MQKKIYMKNLINTIANAVFTGKTKTENVIKPKTKSPVKRGKLTATQKAEIIDKITRFTSEKLGKSFTHKILISQEDYQRQPFYGLNQLPGFLSPFQDEFMFELKFLKAYLNNYLKENLQLNPRKEAWIYDGIQVFLMMNYIEKYYPNSKMTGNLACLLYTSDAADE